MLNLCFARLPPSDPRLQLVAAKFERNVKNVRSLPSALFPKLLPPYHKIYDVIRLIFFKAPGTNSQINKAGCLSLPTKTVATPNDFAVISSVLAGSQHLPPLNREAVVVVPTLRCLGTRATGAANMSGVRCHALPPKTVEGSLVTSVGCHL